MKADDDRHPNWSEIASLLDRAFDVPAAERGPWLRNVCQGKPALQSEIESLLAADEAAAAVLTTGESLGGDQGIAASISALGSRIGPYELLEPLARGGMGQVFLARRVEGDFDQRVAIKLLSLQLDEAARRRFQAECQHLARLDHPHIVGLLDAGIADSGVSYLVLQFVEGPTLDRWSADSGASLRQRLALFVQLCEAVMHAHQHLVIHRDIKPANVLVALDAEQQAQAKLLDFGISRNLDDDSTATASLMTPRFAAPEQLLGQPITTATDIYGLGVILHVLLTGSPPFGNDAPSLDALAARSRRREPPTPSELPAADPMPVPRKRLQGDLDAIVLKCLQSDPSHRYASAAALRDDAKAWLAGREIQARRPGVGQRLLRLVLRNRWQTAAAAVLVLTFAGAAGYHLQALNAERDAAVATSDFLVNLMADIDPYRRSADEALVMPLSEFYVAGLAALDSSAISRTGQAKLAVAFSRGLRGIDAPQESLDAAEQALTWAAEEGVESSPYLRALQQRALALTSLRRFDDAKTDYAHLLSHIGAAVPAESVWSATLQLQYASCLHSAGDVAAALPYYDKALAILPTESPGVEEKSNTLTALMLQSGARSRLGQHAAARQSSDRQIKLAENWFGNTHIEYVRALGQAVTVRQDGTQKEFAERAYRAAARVLGPSHSETLSMHNNYALRLAWLDRNEESVAQFQQIIDIRQQAGIEAGDPHQNLASTLRSMGRLAEAWQHTEHARAIYAANLGPNHWRLAMPLITQADLALAQGKPALAYDRAAEAVGLLSDSLGKDHYASRVARGLAMAAKQDLMTCTPPEILLSRAELEKTSEELKARNRALMAKHMRRGMQSLPCP